MNGKRLNQAEYMSMQLMEIESFRICLSHKSHEKVSFNEAAVLWVSEGHAEKFRVGCLRKRDQIEPALA